MSIMFSQIAMYVFKLVICSLYSFTASEKFSGLSEFSRTFKRSSINWSYAYAFGYSILKIIIVLGLLLGLKIKTFPASYKISFDRRSLARCYRPNSTELEGIKMFIKENLGGLWIITSLLFKIGAAPYVIKKHHLYGFSVLQNYLIMYGIILLLSFAMSQDEIDLQKKIYLKRFLPPKLYYDWLRLVDEKKNLKSVAENKVWLKKAVALTLQIENLPDVERKKARQELEKKRELENLKQIEKERAQELKYRKQIEKERAQELEERDRELEELIEINEQEALEASKELISKIYDKHSLEDEVKEMESRRRRTIYDMHFLEDEVKEMESRRRRKKQAQANQNWDKDNIKKPKKEKKSRYVKLKKTKLDTTRNINLTNLSYRMFCMENLQDTGFENASVKPNSKAQQKLKEKIPVRLEQDRQYFPYLFPVPCSQFYDIDMQNSEKFDHAIKIKINELLKNAENYNYSFSVKYLTILLKIDGGMFFLALPLVLKKSPAFIHQSITFKVTLLTIMINSIIRLELFINRRIINPENKKDDEETFKILQKAFPQIKNIQIIFTLLSEIENLLPPTTVEGFQANESKRICQGNLQNIFHLLKEIGIFPVILSVIFRHWENEVPQFNTQKVNYKLADLVADPHSLSWYANIDSLTQLKKKKIRFMETYCKFIAQFLEKNMNRALATQVFSKGIEDIPAAFPNTFPESFFKSNSWIYKIQPKILKKAKSILNSKTDSSDI